MNKKKLVKAETLAKEVEKNKLEVFDVSGMQIGTTEWIPKYNLVTLVSLNLSFNDLQAFPTSISALRLLEELNISGNLISSIPMNAFTSSALPNLRELHLNGNQIKDIPPTIGYLTSLEKLYLQNNKLTTLVDEIGCLRKLEELNVSQNQLSRLPAAIGECANMELIDVSFCNLTALPAEITYLYRVMEMNLGTNRLTELPDDIGRMTRLCALNVSDNQLVDLPLSIGKCISLGKLGSGIRLDRNPIKSQQMLIKFNIGTDHLLDFLEKRMIVQGEPQFSPLPKLPPRQVRDPNNPNKPAPAPATSTPQPSPAKPVAQSPAVNTPAFSSSPNPSPGPAARAFGQQYTRVGSSGNLVSSQTTTPVGTPRSTAPVASGTAEDKFAALKQYSQRSVDDVRMKLQFIKDKLPKINTLEEMAAFAPAVKKLNSMLEQLDQIIVRDKITTPLQQSATEDKIVLYKRIVQRAFQEIDLAIFSTENFLSETSSLADLAKAAKILKDFSALIQESWPDAPVRTGGPGTPLNMSLAGSGEQPQPVQQPQPVFSPPASPAPSKAPEPVSKAPEPVSTPTKVSEPPRTTSPPPKTEKFDTLKKAKSRTAVSAKRFLIADRNDDKSWVKISLVSATLKELQFAVAKRLRIDTSRIQEIHTATVLDEKTGKADLAFCKVLKTDADVLKQPNGTFLETILVSEETDVNKLKEKFLSYDKLSVKDLASQCSQRGIEAPKKDTKEQLTLTLKKLDIQGLSIKKAIDLAKTFGVDATNCESKVEIIALIQNSTGKKK
eukprot:TRINITY_DN6317_c0_g1_i1.p1 TRINITY_DN6317_c0_g1~~TRINITY_DN6317_c0_g1_i1.p1  ORF type:complete len:779 (-),score=216.56 TRINITY_DN6317_c0_g1_i1:53-2389(-)